MGVGSKRDISPSIAIDFLNYYYFLSRNSESRF